MSGRGRAGGPRDEQPFNTLLRGMGVDALQVSTDRPYMQDLLGFFRRRERRMRH